MTNGRSIAMLIAVVGALEGACTIETKDPVGDGGAAGNVAGGGGTAGAGGAAGAAGAGGADGGAACASKPTGDACRQCCADGHFDGANTYATAVQTCVCGASACGSQCAAECADPGAVASPTCTSCIEAELGPGGGCVQELSDICNTEPDCVAFAACRVQCP